MGDFEHARDRIMMGIERKKLSMSDKERLNRWKEMNLLESHKRDSLPLIRSDRVSKSCKRKEWMQRYKAW